MSVRWRGITLIVLVLLLHTGCGPVEPTIAPPSSTATPILSEPTLVPSTATPVPPSATAALSLTATPVPTTTPTPVVTAISATPTSEPVTQSVSFMDSGQRLGHAASWAVVLGDLDSDGDLDAFVGNDRDVGVSNALWLNDGGRQGGTPGVFTDSGQRLGYASGVVLGDVDGDGDLDVFAVEAGRAGQVWLNDGLGILSESEQRLGHASGPGAALGDVDGDGDLDALQANAVWLNEGGLQGGMPGTFADSEQRLGNADHVALGDLDGDGDLDALANEGDESIKVWLNEGGIFADSGHDLSPVSLHRHGLSLGDVDGDGDLDVFIAVANGRSNQVWLNDGGAQGGTLGVFVDSGQNLPGSRSYGVSLGDLDRDGDLDAFMANGVQDCSGNTVWLNQGGRQGGEIGVFADSGLRLGHACSIGTALGDLDGDGDLDAFVANTGSFVPPTGAYNRVWLNGTPAAGHAPLIVDLVDQTIPDGERFPNVDLDKHVADADHTVAEITWRISGNVELKTRSIGSSLIVSTPGAEWTGSETLCFKACDPDGLCDTVDVVYTVVSENDAPLIAIDDQIILSGETFDTIMLNKHVHDVDTPDDEITWNYWGNVELEASIVEGVLMVDVPDGAWHGAETIHLQACDPARACGAADVVFWVMEKTDAKIEIMYIGNEGFLIAAGDKKILVDALFQTSPPGPTISPAVVELMQSALPPFDNVDLVLATHSHQDHYHPGMVMRHLQNNPQALFVSTRDAVDLLPLGSEAADELRKRTIPIQLRAGGRKQLVVNGIGLEIVYLSHGEDAPDNLGFIITIGGHRLFHMGDASEEHVTVSYLQAYHLPDKHIKVVFVPHYILLEEEYHPLVLEGIQAQYIVPMHWPLAGSGVVGEISDYFPNAIFFHEELEIRTISGSAAPRELLAR